VQQPAQFGRLLLSYVPTVSFYIWNAYYGRKVDMIPVEY
jgi:hypothetical protein